MSWQQRFEKVHDALELRVGGENGPLISWQDWGVGGQFTWSWQDPVNETRDIGFRVGDGDQISLWACIWKSNPGSGKGEIGVRLE